MFRDQFYCEDQRLTAAEVKLLILDKLEQERKKVSRARVRMSGAARLDSTNRRFVPDELKLHVWQRDEGKCVRATANTIWSLITLFRFRKVAATPLGTFNYFVLPAIRKSRETWCDD